MIKREEYYKELVRDIVEKYYDTEIDLTTNTEASLPRVRTDMLFEIPAEKLNCARESPLPCLAQVNLVHIKAVNDTLTKWDVMQYLGELYLVASAGKIVTEGKSIALTIISAENPFPSVFGDFHSLEDTPCAWVARIRAENPAYICILEKIPQDEKSGFILPFLPEGVLNKAEVKEQIRLLAHKRQHTPEEALLLFRLMKLQPDIYKEIEMAIDMEEIVKELCPKTLKRVADEAKAQRTLEVLMRTLARRFGELPRDLQVALLQIETIETLDRMIDLAIDSQTLDSFKAQMQ